MVPRFGREILIGSILAPWVLGSVIAGASSTENAGDVRVDYVAKLNALIERGPDESLNAEPFYQMGFNLYVEAPIPLSGNDFKCWPTDLPPEKQFVLKEWVKSNALALAQLQMGTQKPHYWFQYQGNRVWEIGQADRPSRTRELFWALIFRAKSRAAEGDVKGAIGDVLTSYRFALDMKKRLLLILTPAVEQASTLSARCGVTRDALVATLASLRHHKDKGQFPADLSELVSEGYLSELPMDPYSDKPLVYKRTEGNFTLYTLGADFDDDGGEHSKWGQGEAGGDYVFWPVQMKLTPRN